MINIDIIREETGEKIHIAQEIEGKTLLTLLQDQGIYVDAFCGGSGECGRCRVRFLKGAAEPAGKELRVLTPEELSVGVRLACATKPTVDCAILLSSGKQEEIKVLNHGGERERVEHLSGRQAIIRQQSNYSEQESAEDDKNLSSYGIAVDIGTTTLAAALVDMRDGRQIGVETSINHQRAYGADVISRIQAANEGKGIFLQKSIDTDLKVLLERLMQQAGITRSQIEKVVIAGNTTMCHLLRGLSCEGLGVTPFTPTDNSLWEGSLVELLGESEVSAGIEVSGEMENIVEAKWHAKAVILPGISAFVGADIVAGIYASGMQESTDITMLLDIGTNGEMVLGNRDGLLVTSAAAGPVFEGGNIACGVPGIAGAVSHVTITEDGTCNYETIGNETPVGICGSGIIDAVSELVRLGVIDENGTLADAWFENGYPVAGENIVFTQRDVREIQMGKSAIRAGIETLLTEYGKGCADRSETVMQPADAGNCQQIFLAGGFGYYMDVDKAIRMGLFPETFAGKVNSLGNSALEGTKKYLLTEESAARKAVERIVASAKEINLALHPAFNEFYMQYMFF